MNTFNTARAQIIHHLLDKVRSLVDEAKAQQDSAQLEANSHVGAMASRYDTFKEEAQYLVQSQKLREMELEDGRVKLEEYASALRSSSVIEFDKVRIGSFVTVEDEDGVESHYFIAPYGGGERVRVGETDYLVITPEAPVGKAMLSLSEGDYAELSFGGKLKEATISSLS